MSTITYDIILSADGFSDLSLPVSSFTWRSSADSFTGSFVIQGHDYSQEISDRSAGTLTFFQNNDTIGVSTEIFEATIDRIDTYISPRSRTYSIQFTGGAYTQTAYATALEIDGLISYAALQDSNWSWRVPEIDPQLQHGITVEYDSIEYYIGDVSVFYGAGSFGYVTLNEGTAP